MSASNIDGCSPYVSYNWKLRSSGAVPIGPGKFMIQAFGVDKSQIDNYVAANRLPRTSDFSGARPGAPYWAASFQSLPFLINGTQVFQGSVTHVARYINNENSIPGESGW